MQAVQSIGQHATAPRTLLSCVSLQQIQSSRCTTPTTANSTWLHSLGRPLSARATHSRKVANGEQSNKEDIGKLPAWVTPFSLAPGIPRYHHETARRHPRGVPRLEGHQGGGTKGTRGAASSGRNAAKICRPSALCRRIIATIRACHIPPISHSKQANANGDQSLPVPTPLLALAPVR